MKSGYITKPINQSTQPWHNPLRSTKRLKITLKTSLIRNPVKWRSFGSLKGKKCVDISEDYFPD